MPINITSIILAGGKSSRMKEDKGLTFFNDRRLVEYTISAAQQVSKKIIIITSNPEYRQFGFPCFEDSIKNRGPLEGIVTGLKHSDSPKNLLLGCDMPLLGGRLLSELISQCGEEDVLLTTHLGKSEPLCSVYDRNCITHISKCLDKNQLKITDALQGLKTRVISFDGADWFTGTEFTNINSREELNKYNQKP